ncbi:hypothetical protein PAXRUDRAFT_835880, partial [Paxillus rubicundulus Ve08.2h10]
MSSEDHRYFIIYSRRTTTGATTTGESSYRILDGILEGIPAVAVMSGPDFDASSTQWDVSQDEMARTLLWYYRGGVDHGNVRAIRRKMHYARTPARGLGLIIKTTAEFKGAGCALLSHVPCGYCIDFGL